MHDLFASLRRNRRLLCWIASLTSIAIAPCELCVAQAADSTDSAKNEHFVVRVLPVLEEKCLACHGSDLEKREGSLDLSSREAMLHGGDSGEPAFIAGEPDDSLLIRAVRWEDYNMPPKENDRLSDAQIAALADWITEGAVWPDDEVIREIQELEWSRDDSEDGIRVATSGGLSEAWTNRRYDPSDLWAWRPVNSTAELQRRTGLEGHPVDFFVQHQLATAGLGQAAQAEPDVLIRRATFDLLGLPPSRAETQEFRTAFQDDPQRAWEDLLDRLLASPHYGERAAQHWFDVARYADTGGMSNDFERSNMWRYRDYVIRSFNNDKPYNEFVIEQLAGDELADRSVAERLAGSPNQVTSPLVREVQKTGSYTEQEAEWIIATGYLRLGPWDNAMIEPEEARQIYLDDLVNSIGQTFLSTTMRCVKCHDHKFDPIPTRDYYSLYATLSTTQMAERPVPLLSVENQERFESERAHVESLLAFAVAEKESLINKREAAAKAWFEERDLPYLDLEQRNGLEDDQKPPRHVGLSIEEQGRLKVREQDEWIWRRRLERFEPLAQSVFNDARVNLAWNAARNLRIKRANNPSTPQDVHILLGGALAAPGDVAKPGVLSAGFNRLLDRPNEANSSASIPESIDGRRLELARWIASRQNPLTARSIVNRVWQSHFGHGIARNSNNFGATGAHPTHSELLDYLAADLMENGWQLKRLHRLIMSSQTYMQASRRPDIGKVRENDPDNRLLAYFPTRRLTGEEIRDAALAITGELNREMGGLPAMPEINMEVALQPRMIQFSLAPAYQPNSRPEERNRRSIYAYRVRGQADPFLELFDQPNPNDACELRESDSITPQVFSLMNSELMTDRSIALAAKIDQATNRPQARIQEAFHAVLGREPSPRETERLIKYVSDLTDYHQRSAPAPTTYPTTITRSLVEELSGESFNYIEILPRFENYVADLKPEEVSANTRALADLCLLLFNTNEFIYVR